MHQGTDQIQLVEQPPTIPHR